jgi:uncharacterized membrane protein YsdA (DUF1294 family)
MRELLDKLPLIWVAFWTLAAFLAMGWDKLRSKGEGRRVRESTLFLLAILGGSIGSIAGMYVFRHKTKHWYFRIGLPLILILQIAAVVAVWYFFNK